MLSCFGKNVIFWVLYIAYHTILFYEEITSNHILSLTVSIIFMRYGVCKNNLNLIVIIKLVEFIADMRGVNFSLLDVCIFSGY